VLALSLVVDIQFACTPSSPVFFSHAVLEGSCDTLSLLEKVFVFSNAAPPVLLLRWTYRALSPQQCRAPGPDRMFFLLFSISGATTPPPSTTPCSHPSPHPPPPPHHTKTRTPTCALLTQPVVERIWPLFLCLTRLVVTRPSLPILLPLLCFEDYVTRFIFVQSLGQPLFSHYSFFISIELIHPPLLRSQQFRRFHSRTAVPYFIFSECNVLTACILPAAPPPLPGPSQHSIDLLRDRPYDFLSLEVRNSVTLDFPLSSLLSLSVFFVF